MRLAKVSLLKLRINKNVDEATLLNFAEIICDKICSGHNQHIILLIEGKTGTGKSNAALYLAYVVSLLMAERLGGRPEDYFKLDNIAVLTGDEVLRVAKNLKQHNIYILDDVGAEGLSARNWQSDINEVMTKILQTFRTKENLLIMTVPDRDFIDKIGRNILHYKIVMAQHWFNMGITLGKLSTVKKIYTKDSRGNIYPFVRSKGIVYNYLLFKLAPKHIRDPYEAKRKSIEEKMRQDSLDEFYKNIELSKEKLAADQLKTSGGEKTLKIFYGQMYNMFRNEGYSAQDACEKANADAGVTFKLRTAQKYAKMAASAAR